MSSIVLGSGIKTLNGVTPLSGSFTLISSDNSITFTPGAGELDLVAVGGGGGITTIDGDSGSATGSTVTITGGSSGSIYTASGSTVTQSFNAINLPDTSATTIGVITFQDGSDNARPFIHAAGGGASDNNNTWVGGNAGSFTLDFENVSMVGVGFDSLTSLAGQGAGIPNTHTAIGAYSLGSLVGGTGNIAVGYRAGVNYTGSESDNILIGSEGIAADSGTMRLGSASITSSYMTGVFGATVTGSAVLMDSDGLMGTVVSSERYKQDIVDLADESSDVMKLRPVSFAYKSSPTGVRSSGLIAEEVEQILPRLVVRGKDGLTESVMYHELPVLLLNEMKKMSARIEALEAQLGK